MLISAENITFTYPEAASPAVDGISFSVPEGSFTVLCGMSGCGKSTLLRLLKPMLAPHGNFSGKIQFCGGDLNDVPAVVSAQKIGFVAQDPEAQIVTDKVWHEIAFSAESVGIPPEEMRRRVAECAEYFGLEELTSRGIEPAAAQDELARFGLTASSDTNPLDLSGGERQRLAMAILLYNKPDVLLLDEPTKGMDALSKKQLSALLRDIAAGGAAVLAVTHDTSFAAECADRCGLLFNGEVVSEGAPREFFGGNYFYATPLCRMAKGINDNWI